MPPTAHPSKSGLREMARVRRDALNGDIRYAAAQSLGESVAWSVRGTIVSGYHALKSELDPAPLIGRLRRMGARLALPALLDRETMIFRRWEADEALEPVGFGTFGPPATARKVVPELILLPLLAFTGTGQRIGYGKGHYDRALAKLHASGARPALIGLAFEEQEVAPFPPDPYDVNLDAVLTPAGLRTFEDRADALKPFFEEMEVA